MRKTYENRSAYYRKVVAFEQMDWQNCRSHNFSEHVC